MFEQRRCGAVRCLALSFWIVCACSDESDSSNVTSANAAKIAPLPVSGCEDEAYDTCDVTTTACQEAIFSTMACIRGNRGALRPVSRTLTATEYGKALAASVQDDSDSDSAQLLAYERCAVMLGLAKPGDLSLESIIDVQVSTVPASYNSETKQVTFVIPDGKASSSSDESAYITLAHEYVHALQDQEHDLNRFLESHATTTDSTLASRSVVEGEASVHQDAFLAATWGLDPAQLDSDARHAKAKALNQEHYVGMSPLLSVWRTFPYDAGTPYISAILGSGGMQAVRQLFGSPPTATAQVTSGIEPIPVVTDPPVPPAGYEILNVDTFGSELFHYSLATVETISLTDANRLAADWRGDRVYFYHQPTSDNVAVVWRLRLATEELRSLMLSATMPWRSALVEGDVVLALTTDPSKTTVLETLLNNIAAGNTIASDQASDGDASAAGRSLRRRTIRGLSPY